MSPPGVDAAGAFVALSAHAPSPAPLPRLPPCCAVPLDLRRACVLHASSSASLSRLPPVAQVPLNNAERVFFIITNILGTCFYAAILGQMALLVASINTVALRHK